MGLSWQNQTSTFQQGQEGEKQEITQTGERRSQRTCCQGSSADLGMCERIRASAGVERPADGDSASLHTSATQPQQHLQSGDAGAGTQAEIHQPIDAPAHPTSEAGTKDAGSQTLPLTHSFLDLFFGEIWEKKKGALKRPAVKSMLSAQSV